MVIESRIERLERENQELRDRFDQLSPQSQAEAMNYVKILGILMYQEGIVDFDVHVDRIGSMPVDRSVVFGHSKHGDQGLRVRLMSPKQIEEASKDD